MARGRPDDPTPGLRYLAAGFVLLVGLSGGTIALQGGASLPVAGLAVLVGVAVGGALLWYLSWVSR